MEKQLMLIFCIMAWSVTPAGAEDENLVEAYARAGEAAAFEMKNEFDVWHKPKYAEVYDDYLADLEVISETGILTYNYKVEEDLSAMDDDMPYLYWHEEGEIRIGL